MAAERFCFISPRFLGDRQFAGSDCHLPDLYHYEGNDYCVLHLPDDEKVQTTDFLQVVDDRLYSADPSVEFGWAYFPAKLEVKMAHEFKGPVSFNNAVFKRGASFKLVKFQSEVFFMHAVFEEILQFQFSKFRSSSYFGDCEFYQKVDFSYSEFSETDFNNSIFFSTSSFKSCKFNETAYFYNIRSLDSTNREITRKTMPIPKADFSQAIFNQVSFNSAVFEEAIFWLSQFKGDTTFISTVIHKTGQFSKARFFESVDFSAIEAKKGAAINFGGTLFKDYVSFDNKDLFNYHDFSSATLTFHDAIFEKPERARFHTVALKPHWFVNTDSRKIDFTNVGWIDGSGTVASIKREIALLDTELATNLLFITYRQLAENYENTNRFEQASKFRRAAFEVQRMMRKEAQLWWWQQERLVRQHIFRFLPTIKSAPVDLAHFLYRLSSFYGESTSRALFVLLGLVFISAVLYSIPPAKFKDVGDIGFLEAIFYSLRVTALQRPEPFPESLLAKGVVALQTIFAPLQLALLALALRRKFMR